MNDEPASPDQSVPSQSKTAMRGASALLGAMPAFDAVSYGIAAAGVLLIALAATVQPAWRAATVEPMRVLRDE